MPGVVGSFFVKAVLSRISASPVLYNDGRSFCYSFISIILVEAKFRSGKAPRSRHGPGRQKVVTIPFCTRSCRTTPLVAAAGLNLSCRYQDNLEGRDACFDFLITTPMLFRSTHDRNRGNVDRAYLPRSHRLRAQVSGTIFTNVRIINHLSSTYRHRSSADFAHQHPPLIDRSEHSNTRYLAVK